VRFATEKLFVLYRYSILGLDQGIGHLRPFRLTPELAAVDSAALAVR
jgi:hypothetical protein